MRIICSVFLATVTLLWGGDYPKILNETSEEMLCRADYPQEYKDEELYGIKQSVQILAEKRVTKIIPPKGSFEIEREGSVKCYNRQMKYEWFRKGAVRVADDEGMKKHIKAHEKFDIGVYANQDRSFVEGRFGEPRICKAYGNGNYCNQAEGLDLLYNNQGRIVKLFIYGSALDDASFPLEAQSITKVQTGDEPLGLWVRRKNQKLIEKRPDLQSANSLVWHHPTASIEHLIMSAKNGHFQVGREDNETMQEYLKAIEVVYRLDDAAYAKRRRLTPQELEETKESSQSDKELPRAAGKTWGSYLNPQKIIPKEAFKAFYISLDKPRNVVATQTMQEIALDSRSNKFYEIDAQKLAAYWVGDFNFTKRSRQKLEVEQGPGDVRVIIDGMLVMEGSGDQKLIHTFGRGMHRIEIEFLNNWHRTKFLFKMKGQDNVYDEKALQKVLKKHLSSQSLLLYVGVYDSDKKDHTIRYRVQKQAKPVVLLLGSYQKVEWVIENPYHVPIEAIVYASVRDESRVRGEIEASTPIFNYSGRLFDSSLKKTCRCISGGYFRCKGRLGIDIVNEIESLMQKKLQGFSGQYRAEDFTQTEITIDEGQRTLLEKEPDELEKARQICEESKPEFGEIFKSTDK